MIRAYQYLLSPFVGGRCRFYPTCSEYAIEAVKKHGMVKGASLISKRIIKCHPWYRGECIDVVPEKER
jgi:putative membrane protein insertion efficiency factor